MYTIPSGRWMEAPTGHTVTHIGFSQLLQTAGRKYSLAAGYLPFSTFLTQLLQTPSGTSFSLLQATAQVLHPMHFRRSISMAKRFVLVFMPLSFFAVF
jgi:hypothetical protein